MDGGVFIIVVLSILAATLICCLPIVLVFWAVMRKKRRGTENGNEEVRLRRIWDGLQRMEDRLENIETIVGTRRRRERSSSRSGPSSEEY